MDDQDVRKRPQTQSFHRPLLLMATTWTEPRIISTELSNKHGSKRDDIQQKGSFYTAQYPVRRTAQSALHSAPWQTCSFRHQLGFSGKHSSQAAITRND